MELPLSSSLQDKLFEIRAESDGIPSKIVSYFPLSEHERREIVSAFEHNDSIEFRSIFSDTITDEQWSMTKDQIKQKFNAELFDIDDSRP